MPSAPAQKVASINAAKAALGPESSKYDHLSAPPSQVQSRTQTPAEVHEPSAEVAKVADDTQVPFSPAVADKVEETSESKPELKTIEGSEATAEPRRDVKKAGSTDADAEASKNAADVAKGVEGLQVGDGKDIQKQDAKESEDAGKSVED